MIDAAQAPHALFLLGSRVKPCGKVAGRFSNLTAVLHPVVNSSSTVSLIYLSCAWRENKIHVSSSSTSYFANCLPGALPALEFPLR